MCYILIKKYFITSQNDQEFFVANCCLYSGSLNYVFACDLSCCLPCSKLGSDDGYPILNLKANDGIGIPLAPQ